jgi:hypothetical protein
MPSTTFAEAHNFGMFMIKAVLNGRAGEVIGSPNIIGHVRLA